MIKKLTVSAAVFAVASIAGAALAGNPSDKITADNPTWSDSGFGSIKNDNNDKVRFGYDGRIAIPGGAGDVANDNSAVSPWTTLDSGGIVDPKGLD